MRALKIGLATWVVIWAALMLLALLLSTGEPVCEGPLILGVDDSLPPECESPIAGLLIVAPRVLLAGAIIVGASVGAANLRRRRRHA
jgi:hypothetical protein